MIQTRSIVFGVLFALAIVGAGLVLIFAKDWVWSLFDLFYSMLGIQGERTRMWEMFITTCGVMIAAFGLFVLGAVIMRVRNEPKR
jgi:NADH:ubiquinone oxidoreductase subunit 6 (subunit J)